MPVLFKHNLVNFKQGVSVSKLAKWSRYNLVYRCDLIHCVLVTPCYLCNYIIPGYEIVGFAGV